MDAKSGVYWFDGYAGESAVLFDDYGLTNKVNWCFLLHLTDGYEIRIPVKGSFCVWKPTTVIFTSNTHWHDWYPEVIDKSAFERRISSVVEHEEEWQPAEEESETF